MIRVHDWLRLQYTQSSMGKKDGVCTFYHDTMRRLHRPHNKLGARAFSFCYRRQVFRQFES